VFKPVFLLCLLASAQPFDRPPADDDEVWARKKAKVVSRLPREDVEAAGRFVNGSMPRRLADILAVRVFEEVVQIRELHANKRAMDPGKYAAVKGERLQNIGAALRDVSPQMRRKFIKMFSKTLEEVGYGEKKEPSGAGPERKPRKAPGVALLVLLALLASPLLLLFICRRKIAAWIVHLGTGTVQISPTAPTAELTPTPGRIPTGYKFVRQIGSGGMGAVYEAEELSLERRVAVKRMRGEIRSDPRECERFLKEARTVAKLQHPNIVQIYAVVEREGDIYLVFEYLDGLTLDALIAKHKRFSIHQTRGVLAQVCAALHYAHENAVIHRDLKPSNIMVTQQLLVKVMDFGVARQAKDAMSRLSMTNTVAGTPPYMAPESDTGVVRKESDLYSLGVCAYEMLTGERPFQGSGAGMLLQKMKMEYAPVSGKAAGLSQALDAFFAKALHADPEKRHRSSAEFVRDFDAAAGLTPPRVS